MFFVILYFLDAKCRTINNLSKTERSLYDNNIFIILSDASILITLEPFKYLIMNYEWILWHLSFHY